LTLVLSSVALALAVTPVSAQGEDDEDGRRYEEPEQDLSIPLPEDENRDKRTPQSLLVVPLLALDKDSTPSARAVSRILTEGLAERRHLDVYRMSQVPAIYDGDKDVEAALYMRGCPPDQELGCQLILGEKVDVDRVVSGTCLQDGAQAIVTVTILNVPLAELEYSFEVELAPGRFTELMEAIELTLEQLADPFDEDEVVDETALAEAERERRRAAKERAAMRAMDLMLPDSAFAPLEGSREIEREQITEEDLLEQEQSELITTDWEDVGLTKAQYVRWHNSRLSLDVWKERKANHFLQPILGLSIGYLSGPLGVHYQGHWILEEDNLSNVVDSRSQQQPASGKGFHAAATLGFGFTTFLDFEFTASVAFSRMNVELQEYEVESDGTVSPPYPPSDERPQVFVYGLAWKVRAYPVQLWRIKPTIAAGFGVMIYPAVTDLFELGSQVYAHDEGFVDHLLVIEPGAVIELSRHIAVTADFCLGIGLRPESARVFVVDPYTESDLLDAVEAPALPAPVYVGIRVGVQVRLLRPQFPELR